MKADYGITIPRKLFTGLPAAAKMLPMVVNCAATNDPGTPRPGLDYYRLVPEWIAWMGLMTAEQR
jgi:hypothetical protein